MKRCRWPSTRFYANRASSSSATTTTTTTTTRLLLRQRRGLEANGPISVAQWIKTCLSDPDDGYYTRKDHVLGSKGDFTTAPEISQVFGELLALAIVLEQRQRGRGEEVAEWELVELGPGRGTLMEDVLRTLAHFPDVYTALLRIHLVETSPVLRRVQRERLQRLLGTQIEHVFWHDRLQDLPNALKRPFFIANEFFDALPVHVFQKEVKAFHEVLVDIDRASEGLRLVVSPTPTPASIAFTRDRRFQAISPGQRIEVSPAAWTEMHTMARLVAQNDGRALVLDYGADHVHHASLRGFANHKIVDLFHRPGQTDLTANVDFAYLRSAAHEAGAAYHGPITQAALLTSLGHALRLDRLLAALPPERRETVRSAAMRIVDPITMGREHKAVTLTAKARPPPAGFAQRGAALDRVISTSSVT